MFGSGMRVYTGALAINGDFVHGRRAESLEGMVFDGCSGLYFRFFDGFGTSIAGRFVVASDR
jgi:hypothetical protein